MEEIQNCQEEIKKIGRKKYKKKYQEEIQQIARKKYKKIQGEIKRKQEEIQKV